MSASASMSGEGPAVVLRSQYVHVRAFLVAAIVALGIALGYVLATDDDAGSTTVSQAPAAHVPLTNPAHDSHDVGPCGYHYVGSILVGKQCATSAERPH